MSGPQLNRALVLEERQDTADGAGGFLSTWASLGMLWAQVDGFAGREVGQLGVERSEVRLKITVRAVPVGAPERPRPDQRFREGNRLYRITAVSEQEPKARYLTCYAAEEVAS